MKLKLYLGLLILFVSFGCGLGKAELTSDLKEIRFAGRTTNSTGVTETSEAICQYNPDSGAFNPFGMRAYVTLKEKEGNTSVIFEQFPSNVSVEGKKSQEAVTISTIKEMIFYKTSIDETRKLLLENNNYYSELLGYDIPNGFAYYNKLLSCRKSINSR